ncbi:MAG: HesA/MoeB/ThiF family protein [Desulfobacterales bacterium]|nr:HesA/MoeB/ThiF family protein [Desulfobacterales bacterium]MDX2511152.1 HesA/MoeB/ThiF family protein [Desulfobacterales bacterium]
MIDPLSPQEHIRYSRQIMLPAFGEKGQNQLKRASIFVAGLGGLGSISAYYLAAAGVGRLKIVDKDNVGLENLNRQILHGTRDIGRSKTDSAVEKLHALNPLCRIDAVKAEIRKDNVSKLLSDCHIIVDATDNIETRKHLNSVSVTNHIPFIYGGIDGFTGMVTTLVPGDTPCLECLFPKTVSTTRQVGVMGPIPGMIGAIQSLEAIKICLGMNDLLKNTLLYINGMDMRIKKLKLERDPDCRCCGNLTHVRNNG